MKNSLLFSAGLFLFSAAFLVSCAGTDPSPAVDGETLVREMRAERRSEIESSKRLRAGSPDGSVPESLKKFCAEKGWEIVPVRCPAEMLPGLLRAGIIDAAVLPEKEGSSPEKWHFYELVPGVAAGNSLLGEPPPAQRN